MTKPIWKTYLEEEQKKVGKKCKQVNDFPPHLRGFTQNRYGGHQSQNLRTYGGQFGAAGPCKSLSREQIKHLADTGQVPGLGAAPRLPLRSSPNR